MPSWSVEMTTAAVIPVATKLVFKAEIEIERRGNSYWVGSVRIPVDVFYLMEELSVMELRSPWHLDSGERDIDGLQGLQRRISSTDPGDVRCFFIPASYLLMIIER
jgi:hypothetical protein